MPSVVSTLAILLPTPTPSLRWISACFAPESSACKSRTWLDKGRWHLWTLETAQVGCHPGPGATQRPKTAAHLLRIDIPVNTALYRFSNIVWRCTTMYIPVFSRPKRHSNMAAPMSVARSPLGKTCSRHPSPSNVLQAKGGLSLLNVCH
jgi:hypothetical protein